MSLEFLGLADVVWISYYDKAIFATSCQFFKGKRKTEAFCADRVRYILFVWLDRGFSPVQVFKRVLWPQIILFEVFIFSCHKETSCQRRSDDHVCASVNFAEWGVSSLLWYSYQPVIFFLVRKFRNLDEVIWENCRCPKLVVFHSER